jgi:AbrB family looped-hinge helix DNA binding protein
MSSSLTRLSSKGQIVIPAWIRKKLALSPGTEFTVELQEGPGPERAIVLRYWTATAFEGRLEKGYRWLAQRGESLVEGLHEARRQARLRERRRTGRGA